MGSRARVQLVSVMILPAARSPRLRRGILRSIYDAVDRAVHETNGSPLGLVPAAGRGVPVIELSGRAMVGVSAPDLDPSKPAERSLAPLSPADERGMASFGLDLILVTRHTLIPPNLNRVSRLGAIVLSIGSEGEPSASPDWLAITASPRGVVAATAELYTSSGLAPVVRRQAVANAHPNSVLHTMAHAARAAIPLLGDIVQQVSGDAAIKARATVGEPSPTPGTSEFRSLGAIANKLIRSKFTRSRDVDRWVLAYRWSEADLAAGIGPEDDFRVLEPPEGYLWADPFPMTDGGRHFVLFEEMTLEGRGRGILRAIELDRSGRAGEAVTVLERPYHLSYPFVFEHRGSHFLLPETSEAGRVELYRATHSVPNSWELEQVLLDDVRLVDSTVVQIDGRWWLFACRVRQDSEWMDLVLYHAPSPLGPWVPHPLNPVCSDVRHARPAGGLFRSRGEWYRPAQDCSRTYGGAVSIRRITQLTEREYCEEPAARWEPAPARGWRGLHTVNAIAGLQLIDLKRR